MGLTVKSLQIGEQSRTKFKIHKGFTAIRANSSSLGVETYLAEYQTGSMISWNTSSSDPTTNKGLYRNQIHHSINTMFYRNYNNHPGETMNPGGAFPQNQDRILDRKATVISISQKRYGELIHPGSFKIEGKDGVGIVDDKQGNLIDARLTTTYMIASSSELLRLSFNECHEFVGLTDGPGARYRKEYQLNISGSSHHYITNFQLDDTSNLRQKIYAYNMRFEERDGSFGTHAVFNGLGGSASPINATNPDRGGQGNIIVSDRHDMKNALNKLDRPVFENGQDFAVAFWMRMPESQSVTQSFEGFEPESANRQYATSKYDHDTNVLVCKQGMTNWRRSPFMIETFNQRVGDVDTSLGGDVVGANSAFAGGNASGLLGDSTGAMADGASTGLQGSGATLSQAMPYLNIGKDLIMGSDNLTGNQFGDAALRGGLAYATGGLSEIGYAVGDMFDWW